MQYSDFIAHFCYILDVNIEGRPTFHESSLNAKPLAYSH